MTEKKDKTTPRHTYIKNKNRIKIFLLPVENSIFQRGLNGPTKTLPHKKCQHYVDMITGQN